MKFIFLPNVKLVAALTKLLVLGLAALVFSSTARADTFEQEFENERDATFYSGFNAYSSWQYQAYEPFDSSLGELESVEVSVSITLSGQAGDTFRFRNSFFTGWSPAAYQHYDDETIVGISANEQIDRTYSYTTPAEVAPWIDPDYATVGAFQYFESRSYGAAHSVFVATTVTYTYNMPDDRDGDGVDDDDDLFPDDPKRATIIDHINCIIEYVSDDEVILDSDWKNKKMRKAYLNKLEVILELVTAAEAAQDPEAAALIYAEALGKVNNDLIKKTDGLQGVGASEKNDWLKVQAAQDIVYPDLLFLSEYLLEKLQ